MAWLLDEDMLGGFHFNDRRYADDDLTLGSIDPYQVFRIFHEIPSSSRRRATRADIAYMIDQCHNLKAKIEAMIQTVTWPRNFMPKRRWSITRGSLRRRRNADLVEAESCLQDASRPMFDPRSASGASRKVCRKIRSRHFARADIWNASRESAAGESAA